MKLLHAILVGLALGGAGLASAAAAAPLPTPKTDDQLRETLLKLNELSSDKITLERLRELAKDKPIAKRLVAIAVKMQADAKPKEKPFKFNAAYLLGNLALNQKDYASAKGFFEFCEETAKKLDSELKLAQALEGQIDVAYASKDYARVIAKCEAVLSIASEADELEELTRTKTAAIRRMIFAVAKNGDTEKAFRIIDGIPYKPWYLHQLRSDLHRELDKPDEAIAALEDSMKAMEDDEKLDDETKIALRNRIRYSTANIYVDLQKVDKAATILEQLVKDDPENPTYPNDLGFIWCDNDKNLEQAEKLVRKALEIDEKNRKKLFADKKIDEETAKKQTAAYLDSLGWVLFKNKKYSEAETYLLKASEDEEEAEHIEIWDHLADCYMAQGKVQLAVDTWTKSLTFDDVSKRDIERRKKVSVKLQKAKASLQKKDEKKDEKEKK